MTAASDGTWSLNAIVSGGGKGGVVTHSFTETSVDSSGTQFSSDGVTIFAQAGRQSLHGGSGNDVLIGAPNDTLTGGGGSDTFVFSPAFGKNTITDFNVTQDVIAFKSSLFANTTFAQVISQAHDSNGNAVIVVDSTDTVTLTGILVAQLQASDFHFF